MEKIPTAEEMEMSGKYDDYSSMMIAFAKLHVQAALQNAAKKAKIIHKIDGDLYRVQEIDEKSILKSYPLNKIQ